MAVFVRLGLKPIVVVVHKGSGQAQEAEAGAGTSSNKKGAGAYTMSGADYIKIVEEKLMGHPNNRAAVVGGRLKLVHDRHTAHTSKAFKTFASRDRLGVVLLPAKASDLDPLDYGVFGGVVKQFDKQVLQRRLDWQDHCQLLLQLLEAVNPDAAIKSLPGGIKKCIEANGHHFEKWAAVACWFCCTALHPTAQMLLWHVSSYNYLCRMRFHLLCLACIALRLPCRNGTGLVPVPWLPWQPAWQTL